MSFHYLKWCACNIVLVFLKKKTLFHWLPFSCDFQLNYYFIAIFWHFISLWLCLDHFQTLIANLQLVNLVGGEGFEEWKNGCFTCWLASDPQYVQRGTVRDIPVCALSGDYAFKPMPLVTSEFHCFEHEQWLDFFLQAGATWHGTKRALCCSGWIDNACQQHKKGVIYSNENIWSCSESLIRAQQPISLAFSSPPPCCLI